LVQTTVTFWKNLAQVPIGYTRGQICTYKQVTPAKIQTQTGNLIDGSTTPTGRLCYRPAEFFRHPCFIARSKKSSYFSTSFLIFQKCIYLKLRNLKLFKSGSIFI